MSDEERECLVRLETKFDVFLEQYSQNREEAKRESKEHRDHVQVQIDEIHLLLTGNGKMGTVQKTDIMWKIGPYGIVGLLLALGGPQLWPYISALLP
jgi:hypothetical protein